MRTHYFILLFISFFFLSGCASQVHLFTKEEVTTINVEGCRLDGPSPGRTSACERKLAIEEKQDIKVFLDALESGTEIDGPLTAEGTRYVFTIVQENGETFEYLVWNRGEQGSFEKPNEEGVRYRFNDEDMPRILRIIEREMKKASYDKDPKEEEF